MKALRVLLSRTNLLANYIAAAMVVILIVHITAGAFMRYVLAMPLSGSMVIVAYYYMLFIVFLAMSAAEESDIHVSVDLLYLQLGRGLQALIDIATPMVCVALTAALATRTWFEFLSKYKDGTGVFEGGMHIPLWPTYLALPIGFGLLCLTLLAKLIQQVAGLVAQRK